MTARMLKPIPAVPWTADALMAALAPVDEAFRKSEQKWGVARLERLVSARTLESYRRGWLQWRSAIEANDIFAVQRIAPLMIKALTLMDKEATDAGETPLSVESWECLMPDGRVLVVVRTSAEASAIATAAKLGKDATAVPADLVPVIRHQHGGRQLCVWTIGELARMVDKFDLVNSITRAWPGAKITTGPITSEGDIHDWVTADPVRNAIEAEVA
jgi:hypothetical protein